MEAVVSGVCCGWSLLWVESVVCAWDYYSPHISDGCFMLRRLPLAAFIFG